MNAALYGRAWGPVLVATDCIVVMMSVVVQMKIFAVHMRVLCGRVAKSLEMSTILTKK